MTESIVIREIDFANNKVGEEKRMKTLGTIMVTALLSIQVFAEGLTTHSGTKHGFHISHPSDWTVKEAMTEATVFKAVKKFADGQYLMLTVNAQLLDRSDYNMTDFKTEDIVNGIAGGYGKESLTLRSSGRSQVSGHQSIWLLVDKHHALVKPRVEYTVLVINGRYMYNISTSSNKPLYPRYQNLIKQLGDSFVFDPPPSTAANGSAQAPNYNTGNSRLVVTEPGDKPLPALVKAFGETWFKYVVIGVLFAAGSAVWAKMKGKKKETETPNNH